MRGAGWTAQAAILVTLLATAPAAGAQAGPSHGSEVPPASVLAQIEALAPQRPGVVDLYAVIVGGDGTEDVFRKEVAEVRGVLEERFDAKGRTITLVNHRSAPEPEATLNALAYVLKRVGAAMNREEDVLFLHITTHGASNHVLSFKHPQLELQGLTPKYLRALLDQVEVRYRVVVVSACYAGGFVAPLAGVDTMVITAASSTRQSYGCGNESDITEFSRAFYLKALRQTRSFQSAARAATKIIHEDERSSGRKHSYPQMQLGIGIEAPLRKLEQRLAGN